MPRNHAAPKPRSADSPSRLIDARIRELADWRGKTLATIRALIKQADPHVTEEWKWGVPVWSHHAIICTGETYKSAVKLTFAKGSALEDPKNLFNASLEGKTRRAIDLHEGDTLNKAAFKALIRAAVAHNTADQPAPKPARKKTSKTSPKRTLTKAAAKPRLLAGGNPQIPKAHGDAPVQTYIAAIPGWKRTAAKELDALITRTLPGAHKAVKWNSPFYGFQEPDGTFAWFLSFHCFDKYLKVAFFRGSSLTPPPPVPSKQPEVRYLHITQDNSIDEPQLTAWLQQASQLPGERM
jgi:hypothetical protein